MPGIGRPGLTAQQKKELWDRWKDGQSLSEIGRAPGKHAGSIHGVCYQQVEESSRVRSCGVEMH